ncbi:MAG: S8 family serine peptidase, partial [Helicobacter sp.]|nr:S8 family serine peptidase [Helicobacter sp.]
MIRVISVSLVLSCLLHGQGVVSDYSQDPSMKLIGIDKVRQNSNHPTGSRVTVGIIDTDFNPYHPSLSDKNAYPISNSCFADSRCDELALQSTQKQNMRHGSHVAGILLGNKLISDDAYMDRKNPYGIAYGAKYHGVSYLNDAKTYNGNFYDEFKGKPIKIINNSWGLQAYPVINRWIADRWDKNGETVREKGFQSITTQDSNLMSSHIVGNPSSHTPTSMESLSAQYVFEFLRRDFYQNQTYPKAKEYEIMDLYNLSKENGVLNIFGAGNDGMITPFATAVLPTYDEELRNWLVVGSLDAYHGVKFKNEKWQYLGQKEQIHDNDSIKILSGRCLKDNQRALSCDGVATYSNLFKGASLYAVLAPGQYIESADAYYNKEWNSGYQQKKEKGDKFIQMSGTSMATPMASGVAALVQEKYPFLNGAQIADVLLTTANKNIEAPKLMVKTHVFNDQNVKYSIVYISDYQNNSTNNVPTKDENGEKVIDIDQVKQDLQKIGYGTGYNLEQNGYSVNRNQDSSKHHILDYLLQTKDENPNSDKSLDPKYNHNAIITLTKEEVFGQGILDANKALGGLAGLDANRLNLEDIQDFQEIPRTQEVSETEVSQQKAPQTLQATPVSIQAAQPLNTEDKNNANNADSQLSQQEQERKSLIESTKQAFYTLDTTTDNPKSTFLFSNDISQRTW